MAWSSTQMSLVMLLILKSYRFINLSDLVNRSLHAHGNDEGNYMINRTICKENQAVTLILGKKIKNRKVY